MRILIAGAAGFIGSHALELFSEAGDDIAVVDKLTYASDEGFVRRYIRDDDRFFRLDVCDSERLEHALLGWFEPDVILNFAAETHVDNSIDDAIPFVRSNFEGAVSLMILARRFNALYCHVSTDEVYGDATGSSAPAIITDPLRPRNPYAASKAAADMMVLANHNTYGQPYLIFRPSNNFGPRQHEEKFLPKLVSCMLSGERFPLYGDGHQIREWTYAPDTVKIIRHAILHGSRNSIVNITSGVSKTNLEMTRLVEGVVRDLGHRPADCVRLSEDRPGHDRRYWIRSSVPPTEFTPFLLALEDTVASYTGEP